jgi:hypothetical protein
LFLEENQMFTIPHLRDHLRQLLQSALFIAVLTSFVTASVHLPGWPGPQMHVASKTASTSSSRPEPSLAAEARAGEAYGKLPLTFEVNRGQTDSKVGFLSRGKGYDLSLSNAEAVIAQRKEGSNESSRDTQTGPAAVLRMKVVGAARAAHLEGLDELAGKANYLVGNDPHKWLTNISTYGRVTEKNVYPGIDLLYYGNRQQQLEYDFRLAPGADLTAIRLGVYGADKVAIDAGDLSIQMAGANLRQRAPLAYQEVNGLRQEIACRYVLRQIPGAYSVGFEVGEYDVSRPLIIDPILDYSTYLGGSLGDSGRSIALDAEGNAYVSGQTSSPNFPSPGGVSPVVHGINDAFVAKLNPEGTALVYSTVFGGSGTESARAVAVDGRGNAYLTGFTSSADFPTVNPIQPNYGGGAHDAFVAKLNATGSAFVYSTYLGGAGDEAGYNIAVRRGRAFVTGVTNSTNFPTANPLQPNNAGGYDAFITSLNRAGTSLVYSTYLGGSGDDVQIVSGDSTGNASQAGIAVDEDGNAYVSGSTNSVDFPTKNPIQPANAGSYDAFVAKLNARGSKLIYSTYLGGNFIDNGNRLAIDREGNAYIEGSTNSTNFPSANAIQPTYGGGISDIFITKLDAAGRAIVYSTYLGGSGGDYGFGLAVDRNGSAYVGGYTTSTNFPTVNPIQAAHSPGLNFDVVVARLNPSGSALFYSTYLGGSGDEFALGLAANNHGGAYVAGSTSSPDYPTTAKALQPAYGGGTSDVFVSKLIDAPEEEAQCTQGGWQRFGAPAGPFQSQRQCIQFVEEREERDDRDRDRHDRDDLDRDQRDRDDDSGDDGK